MVTTMPRLVALALPGGPAYVDAIERVWDAGDAIAPVDDRLPPAEADKVMSELAPGAVVEADGEIRSLDGGQPVEDGDALVIATSGTTGDPKAAVHTHASIGLAWRNVDSTNSLRFLASVAPRKSASVAKPHSRRMRMK